MFLNSTFIGLLCNQNKIKLLIMKNLNTKLENFLEIKEKHERMKSLVDDWAFDYSIEKLKPLLDDGFDGNDLIEYFTVRLIDYIQNKYQQTENKQA